MRTGTIDVRFDRLVPAMERRRLLERIGLPVASDDGKRTSTVEVPDGAQWEWANRIMGIPGVQVVSYVRPRTIADN